MQGGNALFNITYQGGGGDVALTFLPAAIWSGADAADRAGLVGWRQLGWGHCPRRPTPGVNLVFPALSNNAPQALSPNNDFQPDAGFGLIFISGSQYTLSGNEATLTGGLVSTGADNAVDLNIVLGANEEIANDSSNTLVVGAASGGNIDLLGYTLTIGGESYGTTDLNGVISGTLSGGLVVSPNAYATVVLAGPNDYQGTTQILSGTLVVSNATALGAADGGPTRERR